MKLIFNIRSHSLRVPENLAGVGRGDVLFILKNFSMSISNNN